MMGYGPTVAAVGLFGLESMVIAARAGFEFTPEQVEIQLAHCRRHLDKSILDQWVAQVAALAANLPAPDPASVAQAEAVKEMLASTLNAIKADCAYLKDWQTKLIQAKVNYIFSEHLTGDQWSRLAKGLQA